MIKYLTAGESHGKCYTGIISGLMSGVKIDTDKINLELRERQIGVGRSSRKDIEFDEVEFLAGIKNGYTTGAPIAFSIKNNDNWYSTEENKPITALRSGHIDFVGCEKFGTKDARPYVERSSGRNTAPIVVIGCIAEQILNLINIKVSSAIVEVGGIKNDSDKGLSKQITQYIFDTQQKGDSLGGVIKISIKGCKVGLGEYGNFNGIDATLAKALMSIGSVKGVEVGDAFDNATKQGSAVRDTLVLNNDEIAYDTNYCGGIVGGLTNGNEIVLNLAVKPIPTLAICTKTIDVKTKEETQTFYERSDTIAIESIAIVAKSMSAITLLMQICENNISTIKEFENIWKR